MKDMSITVTAFRVASCSSRQYGNQFSRPQESFSTTGSTPAGAYQPGDSQPLTSTKWAPRAARRSWSGDRRALRAVRMARLG